MKNKRMIEIDTKELIERFYRIEKEIREQLEDFYILYEIEEQLKEKLKCVRDVQMEEAIYVVVKNLSVCTQFSISDLINWIINIINENERGIYDIEHYNISELYKYFNNNLEYLDGTKSMKIYAMLDYIEKNSDLEVNEINDILNEVEKERLRIKEKMIGGFYND